jgi:hypothetical protein
VGSNPTLSAIPFSNSILTFDADFVFLDTARLSVIPPCARILSK